MPIIDANGIRFNIHSIGDGPPVVMVHGAFVGSLASWYLTVAPTLARQHRVLLYDLRGHGKSDKPTTGYDVGAMAVDLDAVVKKAGYDGEPFSLVGHSYGALIAIRYCLEHPERVKNLSLLDAPLPPGEIRSFEEFISRTPEELVAMLPAPVRIMVRLGGRRVTKFIESMRFLTFDTNLANDVINASQITDEELVNIKCPLLCIYGENSPCRPAGERFRETIPSSRLEIVRGGHFVHLEATKQVVHILKEFLNG